MRAGEEFEGVDEGHGVPAYGAKPNMRGASAVGEGPDGGAFRVVAVVEELGDSGVGGVGVLEGVCPLEVELLGDVGPGGSVGGLVGESVTGVEDLYSEWIKSVGNLQNARKARRRTSAM